MLFSYNQTLEHTLLSAGLLSGVYSFGFVMGVFGNMLVLLATLRYRKLQISTNLFVCNLCFSDILILIAGIPVFVVYEGNSFIGRIRCVFLNPILRVLMMANVLTLVTIAFERYLVILRKKIASKISFKISILICIFVNLLAVLLGLPNLFLSRGNKINFCVQELTEKSTIVYVLIVFLLQYIAPLVIMSFLYIQIWYTVRSKNSKSIKFFNRNRKTLAENNVMLLDENNISTRKRSNYGDSIDFKKPHARMTAKRRSISLSSFNERRAIESAKHFSLKDVRSSLFNLEDSSDNNNSSKTMKSLKKSSSINRRKSSSVLYRASSVMVQEGRSKSMENNWFETKEITRCASSRSLSRSDSEFKRKNSGRRISTWYDNSFRMPISRMRHSLTSLIAGADLNEISETFAVVRFKQTLKTLKVFGILLAVFFICMLPHHISEILIAFHFNVNPLVHYICKGLVYCNASINPWLYGGLNEYFQFAFKSLLTKKRKCKKIIKNESFFSGSRLRLQVEKEEPATKVQRILSHFFSKCLPDECTNNNVACTSPALTDSALLENTQKIASKKISCSQVETNAIPVCAPIIIVTCYDDDINSPFV